VVSKLDIPIADLDRFVDRYSLGRDKGRGSRHFLRVKVLAGSLTSKQFHGIAQMADDYGRGYAEITDRQDIQLHWIQGKDAPEIFTRLEELGFTTDKCGQAFPGARYGDVRNIVVCPVAGVNKNELIDVRPLAKQMNEFFIGNKDFLDLPKKFKISITGCELACTKPEIQDLGLFAVERDGEVGFAALVGGSVGSTQPGPRLAKPLGVFIKPDEVFEVAKSLAEIHRDYSSRESKAKARFKWLVETWGVEKVREKLEEKLGRKLERYEFRPRVSGGEHFAVQEQKQDGYFINVPLIGGILSSELMRKVADITDKFGSGELRLTPHQNLILINIRKDKVDKALEQLERAGLPVKGAPLRWMVIGCAADFCGKSVEPHPKQMAKEIVNHLESRFGVALNDLKLRLYITGCPNDCGLRAIGDIGLLGMQVKKDGFKECYSLYLGGELGANASLSELVEKMLDPERVKTMLERLVAACIKEGFKDFREFCHAHKLEELKSIASGEKNG
jgi:sulfite reductase beta subunit-like hemoprotein